MERSKTATYLGFCKRSGKLTLGVNACACVKEKVYLLVMDESTAENSRKEILKLQKKFDCPLLIVNGLEEMVAKDFCKVVAVRDESLANAVIKENETQLKECFGGKED